jgi:hypothetical protein
LKSRQWLDLVRLILAQFFHVILLFNIGCENLVSEQYRLPPVLTDPVLIDNVRSSDSSIISWWSQFVSFRSNNAWFFSVENLQCFVMNIRYLRINIQDTTNNHRHSSNHDLEQMSKTELVLCLITSTMFFFVIH